MLGHHHGHSQGDDVADALHTEPAADCQRLLLHLRQGRGHREHRPELHGDLRRPRRNAVPSGLPVQEGCRDKRLLLAPVGAEHEPANAGKELHACLPSATSLPPAPVYRSTGCTGTAGKKPFALRLLTLVQQRAVPQEARQRRQHPEHARVAAHIAGVVRRTATGRQRPGGSKSRATLGNQSDRSGHGMLHQSASSRQRSAQHRV
mmetsp:Transcript_90565/g.281980  ORF Transcript_90565/g.281980 Transcript_90565/m.281980 type:complete len:205 (+) Transcript_90565:338-952(+)